MGIYFGDHLSADIVSARQHSHWRTGLVVPELGWSHQTSLSYFSLVVVDACKPRFFSGEAQMRPLTTEQGGGTPVYSGGDERQVRELLGCRGSETSFASDMETFADIYTGSVCSLVNYQLDHCFSPAPQPLPHEHKQTF